MMEGNSRGMWLASCLRSRDRAPRSWSNTTRTQLRPSRRRGAAERRASLGGRLARPQPARARRAGGGDADSEAFLLSVVDTAQEPGLQGYAVAALGNKGGEHAATILLEEVRDVMAPLGLSSIDEVKPLGHG